MDIVWTVITFYFLHIICTAGLLCLFGGAIALCNRLFYSSIGNKSRVVCYATGFIGTPIHELSHALMCILFGHKIVEIKLFQINSSDGVLGYVKHTYNRKNIYQRVGNFFIGIAPLIIGFLILTGLFYLLLPEIYAECVQSFTASRLADGGLEWLFMILEVVAKLVTCLNRWQFWVFIIIGGFIALHMTLSKADWQGASSGILTFLVIFAIIDIVIAIINLNLFNTITAGILAFAAFVLCFGILFVLLIFAVAIVLGIINKCFFKKH